MQMTGLRAPAAPYTAIMLCNRVLLNRHVILHYTIPKPYDTAKDKINVRGVLVALSIIHPN